MVVVGGDDCMSSQAFIRYSMLLVVDDEVPIAYGRIPTLAFSVERKQLCRPRLAKGREIRKQNNRGTIRTTINVL